MPMTEQQWLDCADPQPMLDFLGPRATGRKCRFLRLACVRRIWPRLSEATKSNLFPMVAAAERAAEEDQVVDHTHSDLMRRIFGGNDRFVAMYLYSELVSAAMQRQNTDSFTEEHRVGQQSALADATHAIYDPERRREMRLWDRLWHVTEQRHRNQAYAAERKQQAGLVRHFFGNPFHLCDLPAHWSTTVVRLADATYNGDGGTPALHDALLEADQTGLAEHFRDADHPKGCWVLDMILNKQ